MVIAVSCAVFSPACFAIEAWPGDAGTTIATLSEPSGIVWHESRQSLFVVEDSGVLIEISAAGAMLHTWPLAGDFEGIAVAENDRYLYIGIENPDSIVEFDLETGSGELTGKSWDLTPWMASTDPNQGLEGLSYRNGLFHAGLQEDGKIYVFDVNLGASGDVDFEGSFTPYAGYADIAGIDYNSDTGITYAIFDSANALIELNAANGIAQHYSLPDSAQQEGIAIKTNCLSRTADAFIANDDSGAIVKYASYPITCLDADSDGVDYDSDCNDYDASISSNRTYCRDADGDGLGDAFTEMQTCSLTAPQGYVADSSDPVDLVSNGRSFYINGNNYDFFPADPATVQYADLDFFGDGQYEVIAVGLTRKKAYITLARVDGDNVTITKRRMLKKKYRSASITTDVSKNKFTTRFNGKKKYIWRILSSGSFNRSH